MKKLNKIIVALVLMITIMPLSTMAAVRDTDLVLQGGLDYVEVRQDAQVTAREIFQNSKATIVSGDGTYEYSMPELDTSIVGIVNVPVTVTETTGDMQSAQLDIVVNVIQKLTVVEGNKIIELPQGSTFTAEVIFMLSGGEVTGGSEVYEYSLTGYDVNTVGTYNCIMSITDGTETYRYDVVVEIV